MIEVVGLETLVPSGILAGMNEGALAQILYGIADAARAEWIRLAGKEFSTTRRDYINGIQPVSLRPGMATIQLVGELPNLLEHGMDQVELHDTLLGPKVPVVPRGQRGKHETEAGGFYRSIPFRHGTPTSTGAVGQPMGRAYSGDLLEKDAKRLGKNIHKLAKTLNPTIGGPTTKVKYGGRLTPRDVETAFEKAKVPMSRYKLKDYHATNIYEGMIRNQKKYEDATQSYYMTFRTIAVDETGEKVGTAPWVRQATTGRLLHKQVLSFVQDIGPRAVKQYIGALG